MAGLAWDTSVPATAEELEDRRASDTTELLVVGLASGTFVQATANKVFVLHNCKLRVLRQ